MQNGPSFIVWVYIVGIKVPLKETHHSLLLFFSLFNFRFCLFSALVAEPGESEGELPPHKWRHFEN